MNPRLLMLSCVLVSACTREPAALNTPPPPNPSSGAYIDLQPGWRVRVITPVMRDGTHKLSPTETRTEGNTITLAAGDNFIGYETAYYGVSPSSGGVRVDFTVAEFTAAAKSEPRKKSLRPLFDFPRRLRHVRLVYLERRSQADQDMAVIAASDVVTLNATTEEVRERPNSACGSKQKSVCAWIPAGIAVRPEISKAVNGVLQWVPAR
jgi:hypothetical protein